MAPSATTQPGIGAQPGIGDRVVDALTGAAGRVVRIDCAPDGRVTGLLARLDMTVDGSSWLRVRLMAPATEG